MSGGAGSFKKKKKQTERDTTTKGNPSTEASACLRCASSRRTPPPGRGSPCPRPAVSLCEYCLFFFQAEDGIRDSCDWSSDVCSSDLESGGPTQLRALVDVIDEMLKRRDREHRL